MSRRVKRSAQTRSPQAQYRFDFVPAVVAQPVGVIVEPDAPFCETVDDHRFAFLAVEGEDALRIDYCESCGGYLKTYGGEGNEGVLLADSTSLHLDRHRSGSRA